MPSVVLIATVQETMFAMATAARRELPSVTPVTGTHTAMVTGCVALTILASTLWPPARHAPETRPVTVTCAASLGSVPRAPALVRSAMMVMTRIATAASAAGRACAAREPLTAVRVQIASTVSSGWAAYPDIAGMSQVLGRPVTSVISVTAPWI